MGRGVEVGCGVVAGPVFVDELVVSVSEKMRPIVLRGRWIVRRRPATAAFSSSGGSVSGLVRFLRLVERRGTACSASMELRVVTSGLDGVPFSER